LKVVRVLGTGTSITLGDWLTCVTGGDSVTLVVALVFTVVRVLGSREFIPGRRGEGGGTSVTGAGFVAEEVGLVVLFPPVVSAGGGVGGEGGSTRQCPERHPTFIGVTVVFFLGAGFFFSVAETTETADGLFDFDFFAAGEEEADGEDAGEDLFFWDFIALAAAVTPAACLVKSLVKEALIFLSIEA
jgi:hypothetical protein